MKRIIKLLLMVLVVSLLSNCVYFNTFYNAKKYFKDARESHKRSKNLSGSTLQNYKKAMKKCGVVLTRYKNSKYADDALFMLAKCLYYKRTYYQARKKFEELIEYFPNSPFVADAKIFNAKCYIEVKKFNDSDQILMEMLLDEKYSDKKTEILFLISQQKMNEEEYFLVEPYLSQIIESYPESEEYNESHLKLGELYLILEEYEKSLEIYEKILKGDFIKSEKLDAEFKICKNLFFLERYDEGWEKINKLSKAEFREDKIAEINLLKAQFLKQTGKIEDAVSKLLVIKKNNNRTNIAASASYYLGEIYFKELSDLEKALEQYKDVKTQNRKSEFVEDALGKKTIISQIIQLNDENSSLGVKEIVNHSFRLAEYYIDNLNLPDSALAVYSDIQKQRDKLHTVFQEKKVEIDSLRKTTEDSLKLVEKANKLEKVEDQLYSYDHNFIPYTFFVRCWIFSELKEDRAKAEEIFKNMEEKFPENKYTFAARKFLAGEDVEIGTPEFLEIEKKYNEAIFLAEKKPVEAIEILKNLETESFQELNKKKNLALGYIYHFDLADSTKARVYFDEILEDEENLEFTGYVNKFYDGEKFKIIERLPYLDKMEEEEAEKNEEEKKKEEEEAKKSEQNNLDESEESKNNQIEKN